MQRLYQFFILSVLILFSCNNENKSTDLYPFQIAFIADPHVQDIVNHPELMRTMDKQVRSTRLFNENYFAFLAAIEDAVQKGIKHIVIPGDLTDNGQIVNQVAVREMLERFSKQYGISFYITTGNHDPAQPNRYDNMEQGFLTSNGVINTIASSSMLLSPEDTSLIRIDTLFRGAGYKEQMDCYQDFGFSPRKQYIYWETPFSKYEYDDYSFLEALENSSIEQRFYMLCDTIPAVDASYLVEPVPGIWLLSIDGSVHKPVLGKQNRYEFQGSGDGFNNILQYKPFLIPWIKKIIEEAKKRHKVLISFSHYPLVDFSNGTLDIITKAWGKDKFDLDRTPNQAVTNAFLEIGLQLHFAGHMHINDVGVAVDEYGNKLYNIQVPSVATYRPAYKIATIKNKVSIEVCTVYIDSVPYFNHLFPLYEKEYKTSLFKNSKSLWEKDILLSQDYMEYCDLVFQNLVRLRFVPRDLPKIVQDSIIPQTGLSLFKRVSGKEPEDKEAWKNWTGYDLILDLYRLHYAANGALADIPFRRQEQYNLLFQEVYNSKYSSELMDRLKEITEIFLRFLHSEPVDTTTIELS